MGISLNVIPLTLYGFAVDIRLQDMKVKVCVFRNDAVQEGETLLGTLPFILRSESSLRTILTLRCIDANVHRESWSIKKTSPGGEFEPRPSEPMISMVRYFLKPKTVL